MLPKSTNKPAKMTTKSLLAAVLFIAATAAAAERWDRNDLAFWDRVGNADSRQCDHVQDCCKGQPKGCGTEDNCLALGCCWDPHGLKNWCSGAPNACNTTAQCGGHGHCGTDHLCHCDAGFEGTHCEFTAVTHVHVVQSCHLDVGFDGTILDVLNEYFTRYIPAAIATAKQMANDKTLPPGWGSNFMLQSYYVLLYLDCPPALGLICPSPDAVAALKAAAKAGLVHWHAFPNNAELEMGNQALIQAGINLTHRLDASLGIPPKRVLSQRDVPGISRAAIPLLKRLGVDGVSVGVNTASMYPRVPKIFRWQDPSSGEELFAMWHGRGYGGYSKKEAVRVQGLGHVLVTDWNGDNQGPSGAVKLSAKFAAITKEFGANVSVFVSTFDNFTSLLAPYKDAIPVIQQEIAGTFVRPPEFTFAYACMCTPPPAQPPPFSRTCRLSDSMVHAPTRHVDLRNPLRPGEASDDAGDDARLAEVR
jgi:hypothetical protein